MSLFAATFMVVNLGYGGGLRCQGRSSCAPVQCSSCQSTCQTCGVQNGDCCFPNAPIDIDSLTDKAQSKQLYEAMQARLIFEVPEDVELTLSGQKMTTGGKERIFLVAVNNQESTYRYDIRVDAVRGGQTYYKKQQLKILKAGAILKVTVAAPKVADGEIPEIAMAVEPIMPGGSQEAKKPASAPEKLEEAPEPPEAPVEDTAVNAKPTATKSAA